MNEKILNVNFHRITPLVQKEDELKSVAAISDSFKNLPATPNPIIRAESQIEIYKNVEFRSGLYLGTLINTQTSGIAAKYDRRKKRLDPLGLTEDEGLGHPVNFVFDPEINIVMMESVRNGISINGLCAFLSANIDLPKIEPAIVINPMKMEEFYKMSFIKKFKVKIARVESGNIFTQKKKRAIQQIVSSADETNTDTLEYGLTVRRKRDSLNINFIKNLASQLLAFKDSEEVEILEVVGKEEEDGRMEKINLIEHALRDQIKVEKVRLMGDFAREDRFMLLIDTYNKHKEALRRVYKLKKLT